MLTFSLALILIGGLIAYSGWTGRSLTRLLLGDNQTPGVRPDGGQRVGFGQGVTR